MNTRANNEELSQEDIEAREAIARAFPEEAAEPEEADVEVETEGMEARTPSTNVEKSQGPGVGDDDLDIAVEDDTPEEDRGKEPIKDFDPPTEEELDKYSSEQVRKRIKKLSRGWHDQRREKEEALRQKEAALAIAQKARQELEALRGKFKHASTESFEAIKGKAQAQYEAAKKAFADAHLSGDTEALVQAQEAMVEARVNLSTLKAPVFDEPEETTLQTGMDSVQRVNNPPAPDPRALKWHQRNQWFQADPTMTQYATGVHNELVKRGVDPSSDEYYETIDKRVRSAFPDSEWFADEGLEDDVEVTTAPQPKPQSRPKRTSAVAPVTRSTSPKKVSLTRSEVAMAETLGVSLKEYALQKLKFNKES
jgi:hypothetical protein